MTKQIKADLDRVLKALINIDPLDVDELGDYYLNTNKLRTVLEQFVVESNEAQMDSLNKVIEDMEQEINLLETSCNEDAELKYVPKALRSYLTRLKALRELTVKQQNDESK